MKYNIFFKPYTTHHSLKTAIALITAALLIFSTNAWGDCTYYEMAAKSSTDRGKSITPRYIVDYTGNGGFLIKNKTGSSSWSASDGKLVTGSSLFALFTENAISAITIYGSGTGGNRTLKKVEVGTTTSSYSEESVSATTTATDDGKFTTSGQADSMRIELDIAANSYIAITLSGNINITSVKLESCTSGADCAPTIDASCESDGWAAGKAFTLDDTPDISFTASATASNGGELSYKWKSYPVVGGSLATAVDAAGTNNAATYTPQTNVAHEDYVYFCLVTEAGCSGADSTGITGAVSVTDPCNSWGQSTSNTDKISDGDIVVGDLTISGVGSIGVKSVSPFTGSGTLAYIICPNSSAKVVQGTLGGKKIDAVKIGASTSSTSSSENNTLYIAFSSANTFSTDALIDYTAGLPYHVFVVPANTSAKDIIEITAPKGAKSFEIGRNGPAAAKCDGKLYGSNDRFIYYLSVCPDDDCTPDFSVQPIDATVDLGASVTLSVNSDDATSYQWYRNTTKSTTGATLIPSATAKTYSPSTAAAGVTYYYCVISKSGCPTTNTSDIVAVTVLQGCDDEIITEVLVGGGSTITSSTGCTATANLESTGKLGGSKYLRIALSEGYFADGDVVYVNLNTVGEMGGGKLALVYGTESSYSGGVATTAVTGDNKLVLSGVPANLTTISIPRAYDFGEGTVEQNHVLSKATYTVKVERLVCHACPQPTIGSQPTDAQYCSGSSVALTVGSITGGTTPYSYQWYKDGVAIPSATAATYNASAAGAYQCKVSSAAGCFVRSAIANVTGLTAVTASWATAPADAAVGAPNMTAAVTTNYSDGLVWTSTAPLVASVSSIGEITYISEGTATIKATVTGEADDGYCGTEVLSQTITVAAPSCTSYSFHWGASVGAEDNLICFTQKGTSTTYLSSLFTIPTANNAYYVGWQGYWNTTSANSTNAYMTGMYYALNTSKTLTRAEAGNVGGAQGYLRVFSDSSDPNKYVGFIPAGYGMRIGDEDPIALLPKTADIEEINWQSDIVELTADMLLTTTKYDVRLKTSDSYVWAEGRSQESTIKGMKIRNGASTFRGTDLGDADAGLYGKFAIFADSGDPNWYCYFIPYWGVSFNLNGGESWAGVAPDRVSVEGNDAARTITIPSEKPVRKGYHFLGWDVNSAATTATYKAGDNIILTSDITLYAIWEEIELLPLECDDDFIGSDIAADGAFSGTHYESGFSTNEKFFIIGDATKTSAAGGTPEQKTGSKVTINSIDFTEFIYLKGDATLDGSGIPTDRAIKFKVAQAGRLTVYFKDGKNIRLFKEGDDEPKALSDVTGNGYGTYSVTEGTYYIYATAGSTNIVGISFECCPAVTSYAVTEKDGKTSMCPGDNATIRLANSQTGITYQLYRNAVLVESSAKAGTTGSALDWAITEPGTYTVKGAADGCPLTTMTGSVTIANPGAFITGDDELMRTESVTLVADKIGGEWAVSNANASLGVANESDGETSRMVVKGLKVGTVDVTYTYGGCETTHTLTINEYVVCNDIPSSGTSPLTITNDGIDLTIYRLTNTTGNPDLSSAITTSCPAALKTLVGKDYSLSTVQRYSLVNSVPVTKYIIYAYYNSSTIRSINKVSISETGTNKSYTEFTKGTDLDWTVERDPDTRLYVITITAVGDYFIPAGHYLWIEYSGTGLYTYDICYRPVDCSDLKVTVTGFTTLNVGETTTLTRSIAGGEWDNEDDDVVTITENKDGTVTVKAKSIGETKTSKVTYTLPNGCSVTTTITVNADPCPEPTITLYTATEQTLGLEVPLILSATATVKTGTLTYQWFSNDVAEEGGVPINPVASELYNNHLMKTADEAKDTYYYVKVTNTVGGSSKSKISDFIKITTVTGCIERTIIKGEVTGQNAGSITEGEGTMAVKQSSTKETYSGKNAWRLGSNEQYVFVTLPDGQYFENGDVVRLTYLRGNGSENHSIQLFKTNTDDGVLADHLIDTSSTVPSLYVEDIPLHGITPNTMSSVGVRRTSAVTQNMAVYSIEVLRTYCYSDAPSCMNVAAHFSACEVAPASGYSYLWKVAGVDAGTTNSVSVLTTTEERNVVCSIIRGGVTQDNQSAKIAGDGTAFNLALGRTAYYKGMTDELIPVAYGGTWTITCNDESCNDEPCKSATVDYVGGKYIFTPLAGNYTRVTLTYTNANGCSTSKTVSASNPYFVFTNDDNDNRWANPNNWSYSTESTAYHPMGKTNLVPTIESRVVIIDSCVVDVDNCVAQRVRLANGTAKSGDITVNAKGKLVIQPTGALTIAEKLMKFEGDGDKFGTQQPITVETDGINKILRCDLYIFSDESNVGALSFINSDSEMPQAAVGYYFKAYYDKANKKADWQYIGTPFSDSPSFLTMFYNGYIEEWSESKNHWTQLQNSDPRTATPPSPFVGYAFTQALNPGGYYNYHTGTLNPTKNMTFDLECTLPPYGYNIFANSWTSPIYVGAEGGLEFTGDVEMAVYVFATGDSVTWAKNYKQTVVNTEGSLATAMPGQYYSMPVFASAYAGPSTIAPMQGFFVKANTPGAAATMTINYAKAVQNLNQKTKVTSPRFAPARQKQQEVNVTTVTLVGETAGDRLYILTGKDEFTNGFDNGWDGRKLVSIAQGVPYLAVNTQSGRMHISAQPQLLGTTLSFRAGADEFYDLIITTPEQGLMLKDMELNVTIPLQDTTIYSFYSSNANITSRFSIVQRTDIATDIELESGNLINAFVSDNDIVITNFTGEPIDGGIYDMTGKLIKSLNVTSEIMQVQMPAIRGVYLIKVGNQTFKLTI